VRQLQKWKLKSTEKLYHSKYMSVFDDRILLPDGREITYSRVELKDFVAIMPLIHNRIVMINIYRYPANRLSLEIPSGSVENGESPKECAIRELEEETGYRAGKLEELGWYNPWTRSVRRAYLFLAKDLSKGEPKPDLAEQIVVKHLSIDEAKQKIEANEIAHAPTIIALQKLQLI
jgi:ADP-ribose pyrophosphatase